jgi:hypothetical protein
MLRGRLRGIPIRDGDVDRMNFNTPGPGKQMDSGLHASKITAFEE